MDKQAMTIDWLRRIDKAVDALYTFRAYLVVWNSFPTINDDLFMSALQDVSEVGLLDFFDGMPSPTLDELREALTGIDPRYSPISGDAAGASSDIERPHSHPIEPGPYFDLDLKMKWEFEDELRGDYPNV